MLEDLPAEAEAGIRRVGLARLRLAEGRRGYYERRGEAVEPTYLAALSVVEYYLHCANLVYR